MWYHSRYNTILVLWRSRSRKRTTVIGTYTVVTKSENNALLQTTYARTRSSSRTIKTKQRNLRRTKVGRQAGRQAGTQAKAGATSAREREERDKEKKSCLHHSHTCSTQEKKQKHNLRTACMVTRLTIHNDGQQISPRLTVNTLTQKLLSSFTAIHPFHHTLAAPTRHHCVATKPTQLPTRPSQPNTY